MQYTENFLFVKMINFTEKKNDIFLIFVQNIDCGYTLEPPRRGGSNKYPQSMFWSKNMKYIEIFPVKNVGFKGVYITHTCFRDVWFPFI